MWGSNCASSNVRINGEAAMQGLKEGETNLCGRFYISLPFTSFSYPLIFRGSALFFIFIFIFFFLRVSLFPVGPESPRQLCTYFSLFADGRLRDGSQLGGCYEATGITELFLQEAGRLVTEKLWYYYRIGIGIVFVFVKYIHYICRKRKRGRKRKSMIKR